MDFAQKIKVLRKHNHLTQQEFANIINVSRKTVSGWENKRSFPDDHTVKSICKKFDIPKINLMNPNINDIFTNPLINTSKKSMSLVYLEVLESLLIVLSYISLITVINSLFVFLLLLINTMVIGSIIKKHIPKKNILAFQKDRKMLRIILGILNLTVGMAITVYEMTLLQGYSSALSTVSGAIIGTLIHSLLLTIATTDLYQCFRINKYTSLP